MANKNKTAEESKTEPKMPNRNHTHGAEAGAFAGEVVGGVVGSMAGPPGAIAGMLIGAAAGALAGVVIDRDAERTHLHEDELDEEIGVTSGELGAPNLEHPPERSRR